MLKSDIAQKKIDESLILSEIRVLQQVHHPNIVRLLQAVTDEDSYKIAVEFVDGSDLSKRMEMKAISDSEGAHMMYQVLLGLEYLHEKNIVHRNITTKSVLVMPVKCIGDPATVKVTDLSLASFFPHGEGLTRQIGRPDYRAPEMIKNERYN
jgi:serine/threonine protein kinase